MKQKSLTSKFESILTEYINSKDIITIKQLARKLVIIAKSHKRILARSTRINEKKIKEEKQRIHINRLEVLSDLMNERGSILK